MAAKAQAEEMGVDGGAIHAHESDGSKTYMPGANHESLVAHLRQAGEMPADPEDTNNMTDRNIDDPEFSEGDAVRWSSQDTPVHGRVAGVHEQFSPNENVTITGEDDEAVYSIYEFDDSLEPPEFQNSPSDPNIAKPQSSLSESGMDMPPASEENFDRMTDTDTNHREMMEEMMERMVDMQEQQMEMMEQMVDDSYHGGEEEAAESDPEDTDELAQSANDGDGRTVTLDGEEQPVDEAIDALRNQYDRVDDGDIEADTRDVAEETDSETTYGFAELTQ
jgi:hypothetical protein